MLTNHVPKCDTTGTVDLQIPKKMLSAEQLANDMFIFHLYLT